MKLIKVIWVALVGLVALFFSGSEAEHNAQITQHKDADNKDRGCE